MSELRIVATGISFGESPRWHEGRLWLCDWGAEELLAFDAEGRRELIARVPSFPFCIDWLPDGRLLIVSARDQAVLTLTPGGLERYADLRPLSTRPPGNEIVVDPRGHAYVNGAGYDPLSGEPPAPGMIALLDEDGRARQVADGLEFPNGMAVTPDGATLIVAESHAGRLTAFAIAADGSLSHRCVWADLGEGAPDGICLDAEGAVWYGDVPARQCVRVAEGGRVLDTIALDRGCFACALGGVDRRTLFMVTREWHGMNAFAAGAGSGQVVTTRVAVPGAGFP